MVLDVISDTKGGYKWFEIVLMQKTTWDPTWKIIKAKRDWQGVAQVAESLPSKNEALNSNATTTIKNVVILSPGLLRS
jgi:hypothetical protein